MIAIDLGSSSLRCIYFECSTYSIIDEFEAVVKTAQNIERSNIISIAARDRIVDELIQADNQLKFSDKKLFAVTTEAMRRAENSDEVLSFIAKKTSVDFRIITPKEEAYLTSLGVTHRLKKLNISHSNYLLFDLGGGSTEIILAKNEMIETKSFNVGIVTTANNCSNSNEIDSYLEAEFLKIKKYITTCYNQYQKPSILVATAGTPTTMAAYLQDMNYSNYDSSKINGFILHVESIDKALDGLLALSEEGRTYYVGVGREELIIAGIHIVKRLYEILDYSEAIVIDDGLREGLAIDGCSKG